MSAPDGYRLQSEDTSPEAEAVQLEGLRRMSPAERLQLALDLTQTSRETALTGLRLRHPLANEQELRLRLASLTLDRETMVAAFGWDPAKEGY